MCGIAGFLGMNNEALLRTMIRIVSHRGPDDEGIYTEENVGLGHRRLSIIDLSSLGHQPMIDAGGNAIITYNGEIYNFRELREELKALGYIFNSQTDTEVILNSYLAWGEDCLSRFNGMFAFAVWDKRHERLFFARDRIGIKPLYYTLKDNVFVFGSEIKSILCWNDVKREINPRALDYFLSFRYNHLDETLFKNINKIPPGYCGTATLERGNRLSFRLRQYWDIETAPHRSDSKALESEIAEQLSKSVGYQMISDVPVGAFLSSGVDSSTIVGIMKKDVGVTSNTFTVGFGYPGFEDELNPVRFTKDYFKTNHTEYVCKPDMVSILPKIVYSTDELNADPALIPTYLISEIASKKVKVVLSGEGGDELFGGYERTMFMKYAWNISSFSPVLIHMIPGIIGLIPFSVLDRFFKYSSMVGRKGLERLTSFCRNSRDPGASYIDVAGVLNHEDKKKLYGPELKSQLENENIAETLNNQFFDMKITTSDELFDRLSYLEMKTRLPNDLLAKLDSMTMAHSLEGRVPYLDHRVVDLAFSIPAHLKLKYLREKYILRKAARKYLPREIVRRRKDHFFVPIHLWLQNELRPTVDLLLSRENIERSGYLNSEFILFAYQNYKKGALFYARQIWNVLIFLIWYKLYIEGDTFLSMQSEPLTLNNLFTTV